MSKHSRRMQLLSSATTLPTPFGSTSHLCSGDRAPKVDLHGPVVDWSAPCFARAPEVPCHSFVRMVKVAEPPLCHGVALFANDNHGRQMLVDRYDIVDPVKAACEAVTRGLAPELGSQGSRVHGVSQGHGMRCASSGTEPFHELPEHAVQRAPQCHLVGIGGVGCVATGLAFDCERGMSGNVDIVNACACIRH